MIELRMFDKYYSKNNITMHYRNYFDRNNFNYFVCDFIMSCVDYLCLKQMRQLFKFYLTAFWEGLYSMAVFFNLGLGNWAKALEMSITLFSAGCHSPFQTLLLAVQQMGPQHQEELNWLEVQLLATKKTTRQTYTQSNNQKERTNIILFKMTI